MFLSLKKNFPRNFSLWKVIKKLLFIVNLIDLQFWIKLKNVFSEHILSNTGTLMKLKKNLVTTPSTLKTMYLIKIIYMQRFAMT